MIVKMTEDSLFDISQKFSILTKKPETFLSVQENKADESKTLLKNLYDYLKEKESGVWSPAEALKELFVDDFDEEQIWQELQLQNDGINDGIVKDVANLLSKKDGLVFQLPSDNEASDEDVYEQENSDDEMVNSEENEGSEPDDEADEEEEDEEEDLSNSEDEEDRPKKNQFDSEVDDEFFKLCDMENFCEKVEKESASSGIGVDLFEKDEEERELYRYNDFFRPSKKSQDKKKKDSKKSVTFAEEEFSDDGGLGGAENDDEDAEKLDNEDEEPDDKENADDDGPKSNFEARQERLKSRINALEEEALAEKPWFLKGEVRSGNRPRNSLLQEYVEFDRAVRPAPVFTEKTTLRLEDIIKQRMKDKAWDDVIRKIKPVEDVREYRKRLVLDQEKSKVSLAEIYENEFIKKRDAAAAAANPAMPDAASAQEVEPPQHVEIRKMMKNLFAKLDALSNFHYTPKPVAPEIRIVSNMPAITLEEVAPVSTSDAALLAPEEVKNKTKGELMSKEERTTTDKNRERRKKKMKQRVREKEKLKKEKVLSKLSLGMGNKYSKEKAKKALDKLSKEANVDKLVETKTKALKSSSAFFNQLENDVKSQISSKNVVVKKRKKVAGGFTAKRLKL